MAETVPGAVPEGSGPTLSEAGEFAVIEQLVAGRPRGARVKVGPGDDAAVVDTPDGRAVLSTDMLVEGRHFRLDWSAPHDVGRKSIAQSAADIEAMGARPTAFVVAFGAPPSTPTARVRELADGLWAEAGRVGAAVVGGDLVASPQWVISQLSARPIRMADSTAAAFSVGSAPGMPRHTGQTCVLGSAPKSVGQPQNILVAVDNSTWTSRPSTGSKRATTSS